LEQRSLFQFECFNGKNFSVKYSRAVISRGNQENLNKAYSMLIAFASETAEKMIRSHKVIIMQKKLLRDYFEVIEKAITHTRQEEMLQRKMEKLQALEGYRVLII
tara:strand:+ start:21 stop:335 length:315 start_codon:yes stop_codon:yes gene_type:complete